MSSYKRETDSLDRRHPQMIAGRDMRSANQKGYNNETDEIEEEFDEGWEPQKESPMAGRMTGSMEELERVQSSEFSNSEEVQECIKDSLDCFKSCTETTMRCLTMGGKHAEYEHLNLLMDCSRVCNTNADFMLRNSTYYPQTCGICADICDECADTCDRFDDDFMKECASVCRRCAESCREMAR